jgi:hypothetical protein
LAALGIGFGTQHSRPHAAGGSGATAAGAPSFLAEGVDLDLPEPLPEEPARTLQQRLLPFAIGAAGMLAIGSGIYLYIQGQALWEKTRAAATKQPLNIASHTQPAALAAHQPDNSEVVDQVHQNAMAPARTNDQIAVPAPVATHSEPVPIAADKPGSAGANIPAARLVSPSFSGVPAAPLLASSPPGTGLLVKSRIRAANLHSGPGMQFPVIGVANPLIRYSVTDWNDRWFHVVLQESREGQKLGWIRNDLVQLVSTRGSEPAKTP